MDVVELAKITASAMASLVAAISGALAVWRKILVRPLHKVIKDVESVKERVTKMETSYPALLNAIDAIGAQLRPNGGDSLVDNVNKISLTLASIGEVAAEIAAEQRIAFDSSANGMFDADDDGHVYRVNSTVRHWLGRDNSELLGDGWLYRVHPDEAAVVTIPWKIAVRNRQSFDTRAPVLFLGADGAPPFRASISAKYHHQPNVTAFWRIEVKKSDE